MVKQISDSEFEHKEVTIIGAGWSGLACAVTLAQNGYKVCILESARQPGGRARSVIFKDFLKDQSLDNGQHIMLGAYHSTLKLFKQLNIDEKITLERQALEFYLYSPEYSLIHLKSTALPAPLHLLTALIQMKGFSIYERFLVIKMIIKLSLQNYTINKDMSVANLLKKHRQSPRVISALWESLCLATLNTPIKYASAQVFLNVLKDSFSQSRKDSDLIFFRQDLSQVFSAPASHFIIQHQGELNCKEQVIKLEPVTQTPNKSAHYLEAGFLLTTTNNQYKSRIVVIATAPKNADKLLQTLIKSDNITSNNILKPANASLNYQYEPICTIYLQYPPSIQLPARMIGLFNTTAQWAIDRSLCNQPGLIAVIISGPGKHLRFSHSHLADTIHRELYLCISNLPEPLNYQVIIEKRATFSCHVNIEQQRPENETMFKNLFLAGDYTNTHYPATLEGAIRSGQSAAQKIIHRNTNSRFTL